MFAEIITIGDEILIGQILDTNAAFIGKALNSIGVSVYQITSIQDESSHILKALKQAEERADIIIITGGLGPTKDDITKHTLATYFNDTLIKNDSVLKHVKQLFKKHSQTPISEVNKNQALVPSKAEVLMNIHGTAPGMWFKKNNKTIISLPGVPFEMKALITDTVLPKLKQTYNFPFILHKTILTYGLGESALAERIENWETRLPPYIKLAYLPSLGRVRLRLSAKGKDENQIHEAVNTVLNTLLPLIKDCYVGIEGETSNLPQLLAKQLTEKKLTLAIAESCTGGKLTETFTKHSGASAYYQGSIVAYATESKTTLLHVSKTLINTHSVVSKQVASAMAENVREKFNSDIGIATTGNAGPTKGDSNADVGTVFIAIATKTHTHTQVFNFGTLRSKVINKAISKALELLFKEINTKP